MKLLVCWFQTWILMFVCLFVRAVYVSIYLRNSWNWEVSLRCPIAHQNMRRIIFIFCFVSTNSTLILFKLKTLKKHWGMKNILRLGIALVDWVTISGRKINSERKKNIYFLSSKIVLESNSLSEEHILLTLFTNTNCSISLETTGKKMSIS